MDQPVSKHAKSTLPNHSIGLETEKIEEINIPSAVMKYISKQPSAPIPKGSVGQCTSMRQRILQVSLFPDIYDKRGMSKYMGNVDFGN